jgi:DNA polymerase
MDELTKYKLILYLQKRKIIGENYIMPINIDSLFTTTELPDSLQNLLNIVNDCKICYLHSVRKNPVFGEGNSSAKLMFVGEGPGASEDEQGRPFVGRSGQMLTDMITKVLEMRREDVYIANIVKCRPPLNRVPTKDEAYTCRQYLFKQIEIINPSIIVTLGATAYTYLTDDDKSSISKIRGQVIDFQGRILIPTFHPSYLLRSPSQKIHTMKDLLLVKKYL